MPMTPTLAQLLKGSRSNYQSEPTYRMSMLPFGTYANPDGSESLGLALPGMIHEPLMAAERLFGTPSNPGTFTQGPDAPGNSDDMRTLLLSLYGGNAMNPLTKLPENAVGMFAGRAAKTADHAALARAEDLLSAAEKGKAPDRSLGPFYGAPSKEGSLPTLYSDTGKPSMPGAVVAGAEYPSNALNPAGRVASSEGIAPRAGPSPSSLLPSDTLFGRSAENLQGHRPDVYQGQPAQEFRNLTANDPSIDASDGPRSLGSMIQRLYHVAPADYSLGDPLQSLVRQHGNDAYDIFADRWPDAGELGQYHATQVHLHDSLDAAREFRDNIAAPNSKIVEVWPGRDMNPVKTDDLEYPHPVVQDIIPGRYARRIVYSDTGKPSIAGAALAGAERRNADQKPPTLAQLLLQRAGSH